MRSIGTTGHFTSYLIAADVEHVTDVRQLPISRGYAKHALAQAMSDTGIEHDVHSVPDLGLDDVQAEYAAADGDITQLIMGEQVHVGGLRSTLELTARAGIRARHGRDRPLLPHGCRNARAGALVLSQGDGRCRRD